MIRAFLALILISCLSCCTEARADLSITVDTVTNKLRPVHYLNAARGQAEPLTLRFSDGDGNTLPVWHTSAVIELRLYTAADTNKPIPDALILTAHWTRDTATNTYTANLDLRGDIIANLDITTAFGKVFWRDDTVPTGQRSTDFFHVGLGYDRPRSQLDASRDGIVDRAEYAFEVKWSGVSGKPATFPPELTGITYQGLRAADSTALEAIDATELTNGEPVYLEGFSTRGDTGAGFFWLDKSGSLGASAENGRDLFAADGGSNWYWRRFYAWTETVADCIVSSGTGTIKLETLDARQLPNGYRLDVAGYYARGDGGGGRFWLDKSGSLGAAAQNGATIFAATGGSNWYWRRAEQGRLTAEMCGAKGDGTTDDTAALQRMANVGEHIGLSKAKRYRTTSPLRINKKVDFDLAGSEIHYDGAGGWPNNYIIHIGPDVGDNYVEYWEDFRVHNRTTGLAQNERTFAFDNVTGLSVGQEVSVVYGFDEFDANQPQGVYFTRIAAISGSNVTLVEGLPEPANVYTLAYTPGSLSGGSFAEGDTITQGGVSATITHVQTDANFSYHRLSVKNITGGNFAAGSITNGTATATLTTQEKGTSVAQLMRVGVLTATHWPHGSRLYGGKLSFSAGVGKQLLHGLLVAYSKDITWHDIEVTTCTGSAFQVTYAQRISGWNFSVGQASDGTSGILGGVIGLYSVRQSTFTNYGGRADNTLIYVESQCRNIKFENGWLHRSGANTLQAMVYITRGTRGIVFDRLELTKDPAAPLGFLRLFDTDRRVITQMDVRVTSLTVPYSVGLDLDFVDGPITVIDGTEHRTFTRLRQITQRINLVRGGNKTVVLPRGLYRRASLYFPTSTGITGLFLVGTFGTSENGNGDNISGLTPAAGKVVWSPSFSSLGPANRGLGPKALSIDTDTSLPDLLGYVILFAEYWDADGYFAEDSIDNTEQANWGYTEPDWRQFGGFPYTEPRYLGEEGFDYSARQLSRALFKDFGFLGWYPITPKVAKVTLTASQIKNANSAPVTLVAAPPAGRAIQVVGNIRYLYTYGTTSYTGSNNIEFRYGDGSGTKVAEDMGFAALNAGSSQVGELLGRALGSGLTAATPIVLSVPNANPATGDGTLTIYVPYEIVAVF